MSATKILYKSIYWKTLQFLISFATNIIFARLFQSTGIAEFYSIVYVVSFGISFFTFGLDIGLNTSLAKREITIGNANVIIGVVATLGALVFVPVISLFYQASRYPDISFNEFLIFSFLQITGGLLTVLCGTLFTAHNQNHRATMVGFVASCVMLVLTVIGKMFLATASAIHFLIVCYFVVAFLQGVILLVYAQLLYGAQKIFEQIEFPRLKKILRFSLIAFLVNFIFFAGVRIIVLVLPYWFLPQDAGNYIQTFRLIEYAGVFISFIYYPFIAIVSQRGDEIKPAVLLLVRVSNTFVVLITFILLLSGQVLFPYIFGKSFGQMYFIFIGFIPGLLATCSSTFFTAYYFGSGNSKYNLTSSLVLLFATILSFLPFMRLWGIVGAALSFSLGNFLSLLYDLLMFKRFYDYNWKELLLINRPDLRILIAMVKPTR